MSTGESFRSSLEPTTKVPELSPESLNIDRENRIKWKVLRSEVVPFTLELAAKFIEMPTFVGERPLVEKHVDGMYSDAMKGRFLNVESGLSSCFCQWDKKERRLNGQHTSWMRTYMPASWKPLIRVTQYSVATEEEFRELYCTMDKNRQRTSGQKTTATLYGLEGFEGIKQRMLSDFKAAVNILESHGRARPSFEYLIEKMKTTYHRSIAKAATFCNTNVNYSNAPHMFQRAGVLAAMLQTFGKCQETSDTFWLTVRDGGIPTQPAVILNKYLHRVKVSKSTDDKTTIKVSSEDVYKACIVAWNAFRNGEEIKMLRIPEKWPSVV